MAKEIINQTQNAMGSSTVLSSVPMHSMPMENFDKLSMKLAILHANLQVIHGEGAENFQALSDDLTDTYLWGCATLAGEALALLSTKK